MGGGILNCPICNNTLLYESSCDPSDININIEGFIDIYTCSYCKELFNIIYNQDTSKIVIQYCTI